MTDLSQLAKSLTKAQREAVLWCHEDGSPRTHLKGSEVSFFALAKVIKGDPCKQVATIYSLCKRGQSETEKRGLWPAPTWQLTPLGLALRAHLKGQTDADA